MQSEAANPAGPVTRRHTAPPLTRRQPSHISAGVASAARVLILLRFLPLNHGLTNSHSFGGRCPIGGLTPAVRHIELISNRMDTSRLHRSAANFRKSA